MKGAKWRNFINVRREGKTIMPFPWTKSAKVLLCAMARIRKDTILQFCGQLFSNFSSKIKQNVLLTRKCEMTTRTQPRAATMSISESASSCPPLFRVSFPFCSITRYRQWRRCRHGPGGPTVKLSMLTRRSLAAWKVRSDSRIVPTSAAAAAHPHIEGDTEYGRHVLRRIMASESAKCSGPQHLEGWGVSVFKLYITHFMLCITFAV